mmetsp:Transcript_20263/g.52309  ORF Transcript_20263/g.52309 Transcript_20263/m.52309 type:complete len:160 (-) Transcript_20263:57-536(-)|eukprot:CAMPEP_0119414098 /NCGR_PEP_ID=MMETSP1335-20130426/6490_1 /TAXON_ID=259385 /ORGANISM="Chrysoculter rhomboideus, Strain RCC1486" /LENGTH=159 /DNA_ID=CAMNT_0007438951 /DNA_START=56 /DNA_END=535 /DNA_ORIENTATION=+
MGASSSAAAPVASGVSATITVTPEYGYVVLVLALSNLMNMYLTINVLKARKKYSVDYPALYAPESHKYAKEFNSVQRAHQNTLESWAPTMLLMLVVGLRAPKASAISGLLYVLGRVVYGYGYATSGPGGRMLGAMISHLGDFPLIGLTFYHGAKMAELI